ncbi:NAD(P)H-hydrate dehydratase [Helicobacter sp. 23-1045]
MQNVFKSADLLDKNAVERFNLSNEILMENAACAIERIIDERVSAPNALIIIVCGRGDNGADGFALARRLSGKYNVKVFAPESLQSRTQSELNALQKARFEAVGGSFVDKLFLCDIVVDCLFGSGFSGELDLQMGDLIAQMNAVGRLKIACDISSGLLATNAESKTKFIAESNLFAESSAKSHKIAESSTDSAIFKADITIAMGALKIAYFSDFAKDFVGEIAVANLGISRANYESDSHIKLLERRDLKLPHRIAKNTHKGRFGHSCVIAGEKEGACILSALSAFAFGSGLVSIIGEVKNLPHHIMNATQLPNNCNAIAFGMGLGAKIQRYNFDFLGKIPSVIDADMFYHNDLRGILEKGNLVLTPHLKEFSSMLKILGFGEFSIKEIERKKVDLMMDFSARYPNVVLLLKGANVFITQKEKIYINTLGCNNLAKGGSGDVLSGLIVALLAQGYSLLDSAINASLAHSLASQKIQSDFGLEPMDLINAIKSL